MNIIQHRLKALNLAAIEASLGADEQIASTNATVIIDQEGNVKGWFENDTPVCFMEEEKNGLSGTD